MKHLTKTTVILLLLLALTSCNVARKAAISAAQAKADSTLVANDLIERIQKNEPNFKAVNIPKMDLAITFGQDRYVLRGSLRMIKDSIISLSVQPMLGIEVARIDFQPEYFSVYDKMNHRFSETAYEDFNVVTGIPFDFSYLQAMFTGRFYSIPYYESQSFMMDENTDSTYVVVGKDNINSLSQYFEAYFGSFFLAASGFQRGKSESLPYAVYYSDWRTVKRKHNFPFYIRIEVDHNKFFFEAKAHIEEIEFDSDINITQISKDRFKRVPFATFFAEQEI